jgi:hypothetical protein
MVKMARKRHGGGMYSEYCPLCELSYEPLPDIEEEEYDDDEEEEKEENQLKKLSNVDLSWLQNGLAFDRETNEILPVEGDNSYGEFPIKGRESDDLFTSEMTRGNDGHSGWGPVFHEDCIKHVSAQLKRPVTYEDGIEIFKLVENRRIPYAGQHFDWEDAVKEEGPAYFISPMDPKGKETRERIDHPLAGWISRQKRVASPTGKKQLQREEAMKELSRVEAELKQAMDRVDALKREVATRKAALAGLASPKKTRKVASKPAKSAQPAQPAQSAKPANCPSHKTQAECPPSDCVWGKTGKCSKKRAKKE